MRALLSPACACGTHGIAPVPYMLETGSMPVFDCSEAIEIGRAMRPPCDGAPGPRQPESPARPSDQRARPHSAAGTRQRPLPTERVEVAANDEPEDMSAVIEHAINHTAGKMTTSTDFSLTDENRHTRATPFPDTAGAPPAGSQRAYARTCARAHPAGRTPRARPGRRSRETPRP